MAVRRTSKQLAIGISDAAHRRAKTHALGIEVVTPSLLSCPSVDRISIRGGRDVHGAVDQRGA
jgi:hypothetical protein